MIKVESATKLTKVIRVMLTVTKVFLIVTVTFAIKNIYFTYYFSNVAY